MGDRARAGCCPHKIWLKTDSISTLHGQQKQLQTTEKKQLQTCQGSQQKQHRKRRSDFTVTSPLFEPFFPENWLRFGGVGQTRVHRGGGGNFFYSFLCWLQSEEAYPSNKKTTDSGSWLGNVSIVEEVLRYDASQADTNNQEVGICKTSAHGMFIAITL